MMYFRVFHSILREEMTVQEYSRIRALGMNMLSASKEHGVEDAEDILKRAQHLSRVVV